MDPAEQSLRSAAGTLAVAPQQVPLLSTATGDWTPTLDADYFADHARRPVLFGPSVQRLLDDGYDTFIELGPGANLTGLVRSIARTQSPALDIAALTVGQDVAATAGRLWERGVSISRPGATAVRRRVEVPAYPFQRQRYWLRDRSRASHADLDAAAPVRLERCAAPGGRGAAIGMRPRPGHPVGEAAGGPSRPARGERDSSEAGPARRGARFVGDGSACRSGRRHRPRGGGGRGGSRRLDGHAGARPLATGQAHAAGRRHRGRRDHRHGSRAWPPGQAVAAGLAMALSEEHPQQAVRVVDLCSLDDEPARLVALVRELYAPLTRGPAESVAWRQGRRLAKAPLLNEVLEPGTAATLPSEGCYLITGGAGGIGAEVARLLAGHGRCRLVLVGRTPTCPTGAPGGTATAWSNGALRRRRSVGGV
jgi:malonyl CoA-acyl carrier protein transacylase